MAQPALPHYRVPMVRRLGEELRPHSLELVADLNAHDPMTSIEAELSDIRVTDAPVHRVGPFWLQPQTLKSIWTQKPDAVVLSFNVRALELLPAIALGRMVGSRILLWGHERGRHGAFPAFIRGVVSHLAHRVLVYTRTPGHRRDRTRTRWEEVGNGLAVPTPRPSSGARHELQAKLKVSARPRVLFLGRVKPTSQLDLAVEALSDQRLAQRDVELVVIGGGEPLGALHDLALQLGVRDRIRFLGPIYDEREIAEWCAVSDLGVIPARGGLSFVHLAMYGLPIVHGDDQEDHGPERKICEGLEATLTFRHGDSQSLAAAIERILVDPSQAELTGGELQARAESDWTTDALAARMARILISELDLARHPR